MEKSMHWMPATQFEDCFVNKHFKTKIGQQNYFSPAPLLDEKNESAQTCLAQTWCKCFKTKGWTYSKTGKCRVCHTFLYHGVMVWQMWYLPFLLHIYHFVLKHLHLIFARQIWENFYSCKTIISKNSDTKYECSRKYECLRSCFSVESKQGLWIRFTLYMCSYPFNANKVRGILTEEIVACVCASLIGKVLLLDLTSIRIRTALSRHVISKKL